MTDTTVSPVTQGARASALAGARITEIDMLRGFVIVLMALDHVRDYLHADAFFYNPLDPAQTTPLLYATRWITHLCAPTFVFLSGVSAWLQFARGKSTPDLSRFLLTRGVWLILLEVTVLSFGWSFGFPYPPFLQVIWAIGWSMIALAALVWLPRAAVLAVGVAIVAGHNLLDPLTAGQFGDAAVLWTLLHEGGPIFAGGQPVALATYPILPWIGVIALGYGLGAVFTQAPEKRNRSVFLLGLCMVAAFLVLRGFGLYGDPAPSDAAGPFGDTRSWRDQPDLTAAVMAFLDVQKYPPSLQFVLVTLGVVFVLWPVLSKLRGPAASVLNTFGAVPFFFYVLHVYLVHALAIVANAAAGRDATPLTNFMVQVFTDPSALQQLGFQLPVVYAAWILVLALLYPLCRYWQGLKARRRDWWLSYL